MKVVELEQGSESWHSYKRTRLGSSESAIIMCLSPFSTPLGLYEEKLGLTPKREQTYAMARGAGMEEAARLEYERMTGKMVFPQVVESDMFDWAIASLDGMSLDQTSIVEIKCGGAASHKIALDGQVPEHYMPQLQKQMFVTGLNSVDYFSFDGEKGVIVAVKRDDAFIEKMIAAELRFMNCLLTETPPPMTDKDFVDMKQDFDFGTYEYQYIQIANQIKELEAKKEEYKKKMVDLAGGRSAKGDVIRITKVTRKGAVSYGDIPELQDVNLEMYRKKPTTSFMVTY